MAGISDSAKLVQMIYRFLAFVRMKDGVKDGDGVPLSFRDENGYLGKEESYKADKAEEAHRVLQYSAWTKAWIDNGKVLSHVRDAVDCCGNLINYYQKEKLKDKINPEHENYKPEAARVLYDIYKSRGDAEEEAAFNEAMKVFGGTYDTISYLFFIKDPGNFLPVSPGNFERSLASVGIDYKLSDKCGWENYKRFIDIVRDVKDVMQDILPGVEIRLIDAHSFLWVIQEKSKKEKKKKDKFLDWTPDPESAAQIETDTENHLTRKATGAGGRGSRLASYYNRSAEVVRITKARAKGICELCGQPAPFEDRNGNAYLEAHHIIWLSRDGADDTDNTAALCPNCHTKMHVVDDEADVEKLMGMRSR